LTTLASAVPEIWLCPPKFKWFKLHDRASFRDSLPPIC